MRSLFKNFEKELIDRFGELPEQVVDLMNSVRIKWIAMVMGLERVVMKKGRFVGYFLSDQQSSFYQSDLFGKVLQYVQEHSPSVKMKEKNTRNGLRLLVTIEQIDTIEKALKALQQFSI